MFSFLNLFTHQISFTLGFFNLCHLNQYRMYLNESKKCCITFKLVSTPFQMYLQYQLTTGEFSGNIFNFQHYTCKTNTDLELLKHPNNRSHSPPPPNELSKFFSTSKNKNYCTYKSSQNSNLILSFSYLCTAEHHATFTKVYFCSLYAIAAATLPQSAALIFGTVQNMSYDCRTVQHIHLFYRHARGEDSNFYNYIESKM